MEKGSHVGQARGDVEAQATLARVVAPLDIEAANGCTLRGDSRLLM